MGVDQADYRSRIDFQFDLLHELRRPPCRRREVMQQTACGCEEDIARTVSGIVFVLLCAGYTVSQSSCKSIGRTANTNHVVCLGCHKLVEAYGHFSMLSLMLMVH